MLWTLLSSGTQWQCLMNRNMTGPKTELCGTLHDRLIVSGMHGHWKVRTRSWGLTFKNKTVNSTSVTFTVFLDFVLFFFCFPFFIIVFKFILILLQWPGLIKTDNLLFYVFFDVNCSKNGQKKGMTNVNNIKKRSRMIHMHYRSFYCL